MQIIQASVRKFVAPTGPASTTGGAASTTGGAAWDGDCGALVVVLMVLVSGELVVVMVAEGSGKGGGVWGEMTELVELVGPPLEVVVVACRLSRAVSRKCFWCFRTILRQFGQAHSGSLPQ